MWKRFLSRKGINEDGISTSISSPVVSFIVSICITMTDRADNSFDLNLLI